MFVVIKKYFMTKLLKKSTNYGVFLNLYLGNFTLKEFQYNKLTYLVIASFFGCNLAVFGYFKLC